MQQQVATAITRAQQVAERIVHGDPGAALQPQRDAARLPAFAVKCRLLPHGQSKRRRDTPGRSVTYITRPSTLRLPVAPIVLGTRRLCARCCGTAIWSDSLALGRGARVCQGVRARVSARAGSHASSDSGWGPSDVPETLAAQEVFEFDLAVLLFVVVVRSAPALPVQHLR
jgi:hypothetical protein